MPVASRILIAGRPRTGKTTLGVKLASALGIPARHADDLNKTFQWSAQVARGRRVDGR